MFGDEVYQTAITAACVACGTARLRNDGIHSVHISDVGENLRGHKNLRSVIYFVSQTIVGRYKV